jgi:hypothetical protein
MTPAPVRGPTACSTGEYEGGLAQLDGRTPRLRGGQPQNTNAMKHGRRSRRAELRRAKTAVTLKAAAWVLVQLDALPGYRCRPRPVRADQLAHLDGAGLELLARLEVIGSAGERP